MDPQLPPAGRPSRPRPPIQGNATTATEATEAPNVPQHLRPVPGHVPPAPVVAAPRRAAAPGALTKAQRTVTPIEEAAFATVEAEMGGRLKLVATLASAQLPKNIERILGAIADPGNDGLSLAKICAAHDVALHRLLEVFRTSLITRGKLAATVKIAQALPAVAAQVMDDALSGERVCPECLGAKDLADPTKEDPTHTKVCERCRGKGMVHFTPDHETQKTALKIGGLLESGGMKIAMNQQTVNLGGGAGSDDYDRLVGALDGALYGHGRERLAAPSSAEGDEDSEPITEGEVLNGDG